MGTKGCNHLLSLKSSSQSCSGGNDNNNFIVDSYAFLHQNFIKPRFSVNKSLHKNIDLDSGHDGNTNSLSVSCMEQFNKAKVTGFLFMKYLTSERECLHIHLGVQLQKKCFKNLSCFVVFMP